MATSGVLFRKALAPATNGRILPNASPRVRGSPISWSTTRLTAPVEYMPAATTNSTPTVNMPGFANPASRPSSGPRWNVRQIVRTPRKTAAGGMRVANRTTNIRHHQNKHHPRADRHIFTPPDTLAQGEVEAAKPDLRAPPGGWLDGSYLGNTPLIRQYRRDLQQAVSQLPRILLFCTSNRRPSNAAKRAPGSGTFLLLSSGVATSVLRALAALGYSAAGATALDHQHARRLASANRRVSPGRAPNQRSG